MRLPEKTIFSDKIKVHTGESDLPLAIAELCNEWFGSFLVQTRYDLRAVAAELGVLKFINKDMLMDGALVPVDEKHYNVYLNKWAPTYRKRFTLAHELSHAILHRVIPESRRTETRDVFMPVGSRGEERLCDAIAAELIMPISTFCDEAKSRPLNLRSLLVLSNMFGASLSAVCRRYAEVVSRTASFAVITLVRSPSGEFRHSNTLCRNEFNSCKELLIRSCDREVVLDQSRTDRRVWAIQRNCKRFVEVDAYQSSANVYTALLRPATF